MVEYSSMGERSYNTSDFQLSNGFVPSHNYENMRGNNRVELSHRVFGKTQNRRAYQKIYTQVLQNARIYYKV